MSLVKETYGNASATHCLKVANGGGGPTGIIRALAEGFIAEKTQIDGKVDFNIGWIQSVSKDSLEHLMLGSANVSLTYDPIEEKEYVRDGLAENYEFIWKDHFWIVGPKFVAEGILPIEESANEDTAVAFFKKLGEIGSKRGTPLFITRDDGSATVLKELSLWKAAGIDLPSEVGSTSTWYYRMPASAPRFPQDCLKLAREWKCLTIIDQGTFLMDPIAQQELTIFLRGTDEEGDLLLNPCRALVAAKNNNLKSLSIEFVNFMAGPKGQQIVKSFGIHKQTNLLKLPLFSAAKSL